MYGPTTCRRLIRGKSKPFSTLVLQRKRVGHPLPKIVHTDQGYQLPTDLHNVWTCEKRDHWKKEDHDCSRCPPKKTNAQFCIFFWRISCSSFQSNQDKSKIKNIPCFEGVVFFWNAMKGGNLKKLCAGSLIDFCKFHHQTKKWCSNEIVG